MDDVVSHPSHPLQWAWNRCMVHVRRVEIVASKGNPFQAPRKRMREEREDMIHEVQKKQAA